MTMLSPLMLGIQIALFVVSGALIIGVFYGMSCRTDNLVLDILARAPQLSGNGNDENRRETRVKCNLFIEFIDCSEQVAGIGRLLNLSPGGACISSSTYLKRGDPILARMPTLRRNANKISGRVVWTRPTTDKTLYGIQLNPATRAN
jgi:PilZ domain-containing protein